MDFNNSCTSIPLSTTRIIHWIVLHRRVGRENDDDDDDDADTLHPSNSRIEAR